MTNVAKKQTSRRGFMKALASGMATVTAAVSSILPTRIARSREKGRARQYGMVIAVRQRLPD